MTRFKDMKDKCEETNVFIVDGLYKEKWGLYRDVDKCQLTGGECEEPRCPLFTNKIPATDSLSNGSQEGYHKQRALEQTGLVEAFNEEIGASSDAND